MHTTILTANDVRQIAQNIGVQQIMDDLISRLELAFLEFNKTRFSTPARDGFSYKNPNLGLIEWMPILEATKQATVKLVGYHPENPTQFGLPTILSTISSYDLTTGHLKGLIDGTFITALRTGAASAIASRYLATPDSSCLGIIGCGAQGLSQLHGMLSLFDLRRVIFFDIDKVTNDSFAERASCFAKHEEIEFVAADIETVVQSADILCTATSIANNRRPLFEDMSTQPHIHINAVGSDFPGKIEVPLGLLQRSLVCPDFREQAVKEGECQQLSESEIGPELVDLIQNKKEYAAHQNQSTVFDSTGWALEDHVVASMFMELGAEMSLGTKLEIESLSDDPKDPYAFLSKQLLDLK